MNINPIVLSIPIFFVLIGIELLVERFTRQKLYRLPDAISNISCGITSQLSGLFLRIFGIGVYQLLFEHAFLALDNTRWWYWVSLVLLVDFACYWAHRMSHDVNLFWGGHVVHHQSEEYSLSVVLRQSSLQVVWTFAFNLPIALLGFNTVDFVLVSAFNTLYQFWIHTETIGKLPRWIELVFNTPSHHRVHQGRNPKYIDKNHAGSLIIWDRMFGIFQAEEEKPAYGITKPLKSWNAVWANMSHYAEMAKDMKRIPLWRENICKSLSIVFLFCIACDKPLPTLEGIDKERWEEDKFGCQGVRSAMREAITSQKEKLLVLDQLQIVELLGRPDQNELSKRSQKFFYYYIEPGPSCANVTDTLASRLAIRFNAMGLAKEVAVESVISNQ